MFATRNIELQALFDAALEKQNFSGQPKELYEPFSYILSLGGKRIRPVMLLMACELFGRKGEMAIPQAIAIELFHNFTLIHDDIMDLAPLRRGLPTVHEKFNNPVAILSGDVMLVYAYRYLIKADPSLIPSLIALFNECSVKVCEGQQMDMNFESVSKVEVDEYLKMVELKTATLIATSLKIGAMIGGASEKDSDLLYEAGLKFGIAFQLKDDWLDTFGDEQKVGKQNGGDIIQNKKTYLFTRALQIADESGKRDLLRWYSEKSGNPKEKISAVLGIFKSLQIATMTEEEMQKYFSGALENLDAIQLPASNKEELKNLLTGLMQRQR